MSERFHNYNRALKPFARRLRNESTRAEIRLWCELLRNSNLLGYPFLRQRSVDRFIADFMCKELKLVIECDGASHHSTEQQHRDAAKDQRLAELGFRVLRIPDEEVMDNIESVRCTIETVIHDLVSNSPPDAQHAPTKE